MVGLVVDGTPRLGAIYDPETRTTLIAESGAGVIENSLQPLRPQPAPALAWSPFSRIELAGPLAVALGLRGIVLCESVGARAATLARGRACVFASGPCSPKLWDTAAASVLLHEVGATYTDLDLRPLNYRTAELVHPRGAVASLGMDHVEVVAAVRRHLDTERT
jgi:3'-phosphoadenosine 5'-phosphosulfate (PAPS) 3'-phosphatase